MFYNIIVSIPWIFDHYSKFSPQPPHKVCDLCLHGTRSAREYYKIKKGKIYFGV